MNENKTLLIVDDDTSVLASLAMLFQQHGYFVVTAENPTQALIHLENNTIDLVLQDMNFSRNTSGEEGMCLLNDIKMNYPDLPVILMTAWGSIELAVEGIKKGAKDFVTKPWNNTQLLSTVMTTLQLSQDSSETTQTRQQLDQQFNFQPIVGEDPKLLAVLTTIGRVAKTDAPVLILGESGTGKELIADAIHINSNRKQQSLVKVNLGGINTTLFESEMFGHVKGAFTDAKHNRQGRFELANNGSLFLDEIGDLEVTSQVKLLRVLQDQTFQAVGSSQTQKSNVRIIAATNHNLTQRVQTGDFREDLLYRINLITIELPPLRERRGDIALLADAHLNRVQQLYGLQPISIDESGMRWLEQQPWPGNIRQLSQAIERTVLMSGSSSITANDFIQYSDQSAPITSTSSSLPKMTLSEMEHLMIENALKAYDNNISKVAEALGLSRSALYRRLEKYGINQ